MINKTAQASILILLTILFLSACSGPSDEGRGCLAGPCEDYTPQEQNYDPRTNGSTAGFTCTATPSSTDIQHLEILRLDIFAQGGIPPYSMSTGLEYPIDSFASQVSLFGNYENNGSTSKVIDRTAYVKDSEGNYASCSFQVTVQPIGSNSSGLSCIITPENFNVSRAHPTKFTFTGSGGNGDYTFSNFTPLSGQIVDDQYINKVSATQSEITFIYLTSVIRVPTVTVTSDGSSATCRTAVFVETNLPNGFDPNWNWCSLPPWWWLYWKTNPYVPPVVNYPTACDVRTESNPGISGTLTHLRASVPSYYGSDFEITDITSFNTSTGRTSELDDDLVIPNPNSLERKIRFRRPGQHLLTVTVRNPSGQSATCSTYHNARPAKVYVTGPEDLRTPVVNSYRRVYGAYQSSFIANHADNDEGVRVAVGDVNNDGLVDVITGAGPGGENWVQVRDGRNLSNIIAEFRAFTGSSAGDGGVFVASGDTNGDGHAEIIVGQNAGSTVRIYNGADLDNSPTRIRTIRPFGSNATVGIRVAVGDLNGDGYSDIITSPGPGNELGEVAAYSGRYYNRIVRFKPFGNIESGVFIAAGDVDGDGDADIIASLDTDLETAPAFYSSTVRIYNSLGTEISSFAPYDFYKGGIRLAVTDYNRDGIVDVMTAAGPLPSGGTGLGSEIKVFDISNSNMVLTHDFYPYGFSYNQGAFIGGGAGGL